MKTLQKNFENFCRTDITNLVKTANGMDIANFRGRGGNEEQVDVTEELPTEAPNNDPIRPSAGPSTSEFVDEPGVDKSTLSGDSTSDKSKIGDKIYSVRDGQGRPKIAVLINVSDFEVLKGEWFD